MSYVKQTWRDNDPNYPASAARFAHMEDGIAAAYSSGTSSPYNPIYPETYGAGYNSSNPNDWGPAITQAWEDAYAQGTWVQLLSKIYGIATTVQPPTMPPGANAIPPIIGVSGLSPGSKLKKLADVTLLNWSAPNGKGGFGNYYQGSYLAHVCFDGASNASWTAPLVTFNGVVDQEVHDVQFWSNYDPGFTMRGSWDWRWNDVSVIFCGATDNANPAVLIYSLAGDSSANGEIANNQWFHQLRIEDWRTGAFWVQSAENLNPIGGVKINQFKFEQSAGNALWGPTVLLDKVSDFHQDDGFITNYTAPDVNQTKPFDLLYTITGGGTGGQRITLAHIEVYIGNLGVNATTDVRSLISVGGSFPGFSYDDLYISFSDANVPASIFNWRPGHYIYRLRRGSVRAYGAAVPLLENQIPSTGSVFDYTDYRVDHAADWTSANPILPAGQLGVEYDTKRLKIGDGSTAWTSLGYANRFPIVVQTAGGNLGASQTINFNNLQQEIWIDGTLNTNLAVTTTNRVAGCRARIFATQSGPGYTISIDGTNVTPIPTSGLIILDVNAISPSTVKTLIIS